MKSFKWYVELVSPHDYTHILWKCEEDTLEKCVNKWKSENNNDFISYCKLHNIFHQRNKSDCKFLKVKKYKV